MDFELRAQSLPNLRDANFRKISLPGRNMIQADLRGADLCLADFKDTNLT